MNLISFCLEIIILYFPRHFQVFHDNGSPDSKVIQEMDSIWISYILFSRFSRSVSYILAVCKTPLYCINICFILIQITSQKPNHPANSFYYPRLTELPPLATIWVKRQGRTQNRVSNHILPDTTKPHRFSGRSAHTLDTFRCRVVCLFIVILHLHSCTFHLAGKFKKEVLRASCRCFGLPQQCYFGGGSKQLIKLGEP